jgi:hypothetical protein
MTALVCPRISVDTGYEPLEEQRSLVIVLSFWTCRFVVPSGIGGGGAKVHLAHDFKKHSPLW